MHAETRHTSRAPDGACGAEKISPRISSTWATAGWAILTPADVADARRACDREGIHLLGFRPRGAIGRWARTSKPARLMVPEEESRQAGSTAAFTALCEAMVAKDRVAVPRRTRERTIGSRAFDASRSCPASRRRRWRTTTSATKQRFENHRFTSPSNCHIWTMCGIRSWRTPPAASSRAGRDHRGRGCGSEANRVNEYSPLDVPNPSLSRHLPSAGDSGARSGVDGIGRVEAGDVTKPRTRPSLEKMGIKEKMIAFKAAVYGTNHDAEALEDAAAGPGAKRSGAGGRRGWQARLRARADARRHRLQGAGGGERSREGDGGEAEGVLRRERARGGRREGCAVGRSKPPPRIMSEFSRE